MDRAVMVWVLCADWGDDSGIEVLGVYGDDGIARVGAGEHARTKGFMVPIWDRIEGDSQLGQSRDRNGRWVAVSYEIKPYEVVGRCAL